MIYNVIYIYINNYISCTKIYSKIYDPGWWTVIMRCLLTDGDYNINIPCSVTEILKSIYHRFHSSAANQTHLC